MLSQVQKGEERPIAFASRQTSCAERSYAATEAEIVAFVWASKQFRCYLQGRKFGTRTVHTALKYLRDLDDQIIRLLQLSIKLSELDFVVEHRAGTKLANAETISPHVGTIVQGGTLDKEDVLPEYAKLAFSVKQIPGVY